MGDLAITRDGAMASADPAARLRQAANQMEAQFVRMLFERMQATDLAGEDAPFGSSPAEKQFRDLLHGALSERSAGSLGIADSIVRQLAVRAGIHRGQGGQP